MSSNQQQQQQQQQGKPGGKSFALMQQRLLPLAGIPSVEASAIVPVADAPAPTPIPSPSTNVAQRPGKSAANLMATQAKQQQQQQQQQSAAAPPGADESQHPLVTEPQSVIPPGRPKGKDFAAMAKNVGSSPKAPAISPPTPTYKPPQVAVVTAANNIVPNSMQHHQDATGVGGGGGNSRPKGKDFAAMANRMGGAPPPPGQPQMPGGSAVMQPHASAISAAQAARAAKMQAAARAAAGYTPNQRLQPTTTHNNPLPGPAQVQVSPAAAANASEARNHQVTKMKSPTSGPPMVAGAASTTKKVSTSSAATNNRRGPSNSSTNITATNSRPSSMANKRVGSFSGTPQASSTSNTMASPAIYVGPLSTKPTTQPSSSEAKLSSAGTGGAHISPMIGQRLRDLVTSLDPNYTLDADAEEQVLELADDFLEKVTKQSMRLAQHRGSKTLDVSDIQLVLAKQWGIVIPGLGAPNMRPTKPDNRVVAGAQVSTVPGANNNTKRQMSSDSTGTLLNESAAKKAKIPATGASSISTKATM